MSLPKFHSRLLCVHSCLSPAADSFSALGSFVIVSEYLVKLWISGFVFAYIWVDSRMFLFMIIGFSCRFMNNINNNNSNFNNIQIDLPKLYQKRDLLRTRKQQHFEERFSQFAFNRSDLIHSIHSFTSHLMATREK